MRATSATLISTLGSQPQIVTFALDYLRAQGETIREVLVLHLSPPDGQVDDAVRRLAAEFSGEQYRGKPCRFRAIVLRRDGVPLSAIQTAADAEAVRGQVYTLIQQLKRESRPLHLSIAGGPRMLALMTLSAAQLYCGHQDRVWHMYTKPSFLMQAKTEQLLHDDRGDRMWLVSVPVVPWGAYFSPLAADAPTPAAAIAAQTAWLDSDERRRCERVWNALTERQQEVLRAFAAGGSPQDVAEQLFISIKTVDTHKTTILTECKSAWELLDSTRLTYHFLREKFSAFFDEYTPDGDGENRKNL